MIWQTSRFQLDLTMPKIMGIVNLTPDSFSDGGQFNAASSAIAHCEQLIKQGADILDLGAESTRPGAIPLALEEEWQRLHPVLLAAVQLNIPISIDTYKPEIMSRALDCGADIINDVWALRQAASTHSLSAEQVVAQHPNCGVCLMHMHRQPTDMQQLPMQGDVVEQVQNFLESRAQSLIQMGVQAARITLDPGVGFGKTVDQNFALLAQQTEFLKLGFPILAGWSRKSSIGSVTNLEVQDRLLPSVVAAILALDRGAKIVRVHDVLATHQGLQVLKAVWKNQST